MWAAPPGAMARGAMLPCSQPQATPAPSRAQGAGTVPTAGAGRGGLQVRARGDVGGWEQPRGRGVGKRGGSRSSCKGPGMGTGLQPCPVHLHSLAALGPWARSCWQPGMEHSWCSSVCRCQGRPARSPVLTVAWSSRSCSRTEPRRAGPRVGGQAGSVRRLQHLPRDHQGDRRRGAWLWPWPCCWDHGGGAGLSAPEEPPQAL